MNVKMGTRAGTLSWNGIAAERLCAKKIRINKSGGKSNPPAHHRIVEDLDGRRTECSVIQSAATKDFIKILGLGSMVPCTSLDFMDVPVLPTNS